MSFASDFSGEIYKQYTWFSSPSSRLRARLKRSFNTAVNDASVFPDPVGAQTSAFSRLSTRGIASRCGGVKNPSFSATYRPNWLTHHSWTAGSSRVSTSASLISTVSGSNVNDVLSASVRACSAASRSNARPR